MKVRLLPERFTCMNCGGRCSTPSKAPDYHADLAPGDIAACVSCIKVFILTDGLRLRAVTSNDLKKVPPEWADSARYYIERAKERGQRDDR